MMSPRTLPAALLRAEPWIVWLLGAAAFAAVRYLSDTGDLREAGANLFRMLRELDAQYLDVIVAERVPEEGIGAAINDRLERASNKLSSQA